jgi:hypothetical protein
MKMEMLRRQFGIAEPVRRGMELKIAQAGEWRPAALGGSSGVHKDILQGRDTEIGFEDVFHGTLCSLPRWAPPLVKHGRMCIDMFGRQRASRGARLPLGDGEQDEDELVNVGIT